MTQETVFTEQPKPIEKLYKWLRIFFILYIFSEIILAVGNTFMLSTGSEMFGPDSPFTIGDGLSLLGGVLLMFSYLTCVVLFSIFSYRTVKNLKLLGTKGLDITPGWAVGWYFIPFANWWKPYGVMQEMWIGSVHANDQYFDTPNIMPIWWGCWLITSFADRVSWRLSLKAGLFADYATDVPLYKTTLMIDIFSAATGIIAAWLLLKLVRSIREAQNMRINAEAFN